MNAFVNHFSFEFRTGIRDKTLLLMNYILPIGLYLMLGFLMTELNPFFQEIVIPSMILLAILFSVIIGLPNPLLEAREAGIFRSYKINGVSAFSILTIPAISTILHTIIVSIVVIITAPFLFSASSPSSWPGLVVFFLIAAFAHLGLGMLISVISSSTRTAVLWTQLIFIPSMMMGVMIRLSDLPDALSRFALLLPATHAMNVYQGIVQGQITPFNPLWSLLILFIGGILSVGLANYLFCWDNQNKTRHGHPTLALVALLPYLAGMLLL